MKHKEKSVPGAIRNTFHNQNHLFTGGEKSLRTSDDSTSPENINRQPNRSSICAYCENRLPRNPVVYQIANLCRKCLRDYAGIGEVLDLHADAKAREQTKARFIERLKFNKE